MSKVINSRYPLSFKNLKDKVETNKDDISILKDKPSTYPIVNVSLDENSFAITLKPNIFYKIHSTISYGVIAFSSIQELNNISGNYEIFSANCDIEEVQGLLYLLTIGGIMEETNELEGYLFKQTISVEGLNIDVYFVVNPNSSTTNHIKILGIPYEGMEELELDIYNVTRINKNDTLHQIEYYSMLINTYFTEVSSDIDNKYKYMAYVYGEPMFVYTNEPIESSETLEIIEDGEIITINVKVISSYKEIKSINEFVFSINTPVEIMFADTIYFNNNDDVHYIDKEGILTVSIVSGVGCYTFKPN